MFVFPSHRSPSPPVFAEQNLLVRPLSVPRNFNAARVPTCRIERRLADAAVEQEHAEEVQERHTADERMVWKSGEGAGPGLRSEVQRDIVLRALRSLYMERVVTLPGYVSVQRFYHYAERGLSAVYFTKTVPVVVRRSIPGLSPRGRQASYQLIR
jgi:hypothetical protein